MKSMKAVIGGMVLGMAAIAGGCTNTAPPVPASDPFGGARINITVASPLHKWLKIGDVRVVREGLMNVVVPVRLAYEDNNGYYIQYKFTFLDGSGRPLASQTEWKMEQLTPRVEKILQGTALDAASDWRLEIKPATGGVH
jgi:hypothetical protein